MKNISKLLELFNVKTDFQYFSLIIEEAQTAGLESAKSMFRAMPTKYKIKFLKALTLQNWEHGLNKEQVIYFFDNF